MTTILEVQSENNCLSLCQLYSGCQQSHGRGDLKLVMRPDQRGLKEADHFYLELAGRDSFYGRLAGLRGQLFRGEDFKALFCQDNGRSSEPPSLLATAQWLQALDLVSDAETHGWATVGLSWKVAPGGGRAAPPRASPSDKLYIDVDSWCQRQRVPTIQFATSDDIGVTCGIWKTLV